MLDQNTTTVLTAVITVGGTLGGVVLGVILSNRYSLKQEKGKRNTPIIEEAYTLIDKIDNRLSDCLYTHELRNEVFSDPMPLFWSIFLKEVEMIYFQEEIVVIKQGENYDTSFLQ